MKEKTKMGADTKEVLSAIKGIKITSKVATRLVANNLYLNYSKNGHLGKEVFLNRINKIERSIERAFVKCINDNKKVFTKSGSFFSKVLWNIKGLFIGLFGTSIIEDTGKAVEECCPKKRRYNKRHKKQDFSNKNFKCKRGRGRPRKSVKG